MLLLALSGCMFNNYVLGGGEVVITMTGLEDASLDAEWVVPGVFGPALDEAEMPWGEYGAPNCSGGQAAWLALAESDPHTVNVCEEDLRLALGLGAFPVYGLERRSADTHGELDGRMGEEDLYMRDAEEFSTVFLETKESGRFWSPAVALSTFGSETGESAEQLVELEMTWGFDPAVRQNRGAF